MTRTYTLPTLVALLLTFTITTADAQTWLPESLKPGDSNLLVAAKQRISDTFGLEQRQQSASDAPADEEPLPDHLLSYKVNRHWQGSYGYGPNNSVALRELVPIGQSLRETKARYIALLDADHQLEARFTPVCFGPRPYAMMMVAHQTDLIDNSDFQRIQFQNFASNHPIYGSAFRFDYHFRNGTTVGLGLGAE